MNLSSKLKALRKKKGWSQTKLADQIGSHLSHIHRIETGKYNPSLEVVQKLANAFDVTIDYLVSDTDDDFKEVRIEDKDLMERIKLIDTLDAEDRSALIRVIDSMLTKKKIMNLISDDPVGHERGVNA